MQVRTTNINFNGKEEVIYGLTKASREAQKIGKNRLYGFGPRPIAKDYEINYSQGALKAYCDMVVNDKSFLETISNLPQNIIKKIKKDLNPLKNIYDSTYPHEDFVKAIKSNAKRAKLNTNEGFNKFLEEIKCKKM